MQPKYQLTDPYAGATRYFDNSQPAGAGYKPTAVDKAKDIARKTYEALPAYDYVTDSGKQSYSSGLMDMLNRGLVAGTFGAPVDITTGVVGGVKNLANTFMPKQPSTEEPAPELGSEWLGQKMQDYGMVSPVRRPIGEAVAGFADPETLGLAAAKLAALGKVAGAGHSLAMLPGFFSKLERGLAAAPKQALTSGNAVKQWLSGNAGKYGIKQAEIEATGLGAHLENLGKGRTSKEELLNVVKAGDPGVEEVVKGQPMSAEQQAKFERLKNEITEIKQKRDFGGQISSDRARSLINEAFEKYGITENEYNNMLWDKSVVPTKYSQYVLPGGENYREVLLTLPEKPTLPEGWEVRQMSSGKWGVYTREGYRLDDLYDTKSEAISRGYKEGEILPSNTKSYSSPHWEEPNVLAHIRTNDRIGPNGEKQLFVEELQSDWAQKGRKEKFKSDAFKKAQASFTKWEKENPGADPQIWRNENPDLVGIVRPSGREVPSAPYITNTKDWTELGIKRIMQHAAENGYDQVAFINGAQSADRYNLSKHFDSIVLHDNTSGGVGLAKMEGPFTHGTVTAYNPNNEKVIDNHYVSSPDELANLIGQELAEKLLNTSPKSARSDSGFGVRQRKLSGLDLQVGGEGMKKFYDEIVPQAAGKFAKQYGAPFGIKPMETGSQFTIDITPSMRQDIAEKGIPAFAKGGSVKDFKDFAKDWYERRQWRGLGLGSVYGRDEMEKRLDSEVPYEKMKVIDNNPGIKAQYVPGALSDKIQITPNVKPEEVAHEWNHLARKYALGAKLNDYAVAHLPGTVKSSEDYLFDASDKKLHHKLGSFNSAMGMYDEISNPEEIQTRLMRMRYAAGFQPDKDVTKEDLQNFYKNYNGKDFQINQLLDIAPNDDAMLRLLNLMSNNQKPSDDTVYAAEGGPVNTDDDDYGQPFGDEIAKLYQGGLYRKGGEVHKYIVTSLTPVQKRLLKAHHAELGDESSFDDWMSDAGIPAIIHGHATKSMDSFLTPEQREMLDQVNS